MKRLVAFSLLILLLGTLPVISADDNNFVPIFNGKDLSGWEHKRGFEVVNGILITSGSEGNNLYTEKWYGNFILRLEFMLSKVGNSGVLIRSGPDNAWRNGFEIQLLAPWTPWRDDLHCTASIYGHVAVTNRPDETTGRWYQMEIICDRKDITISVNGEVCTQANMDSLESLKNKNLRGVIGLQFNHAEKDGQWVKFRNLSIRDLDSEPDYVIKGFPDKDPRIRQSAHEAAVKLGRAIVGPLCLLMADDDPIASSGAKKALFDIVAQTSAPNADPLRKSELTNALKEQIKTLQSDILQSDIAKNYLIWLLGMIGN